MQDWIQRRPRLDDAVVFASRAAIVLVLVAATALAIREIAYALDDPAEDVPAAVRESLEAGFEDQRDGTLTFANVADGEWERLFVFPPLSKPVTIRQTLERYEDDGKLPRSSIDGDEALLVFVDSERVLGTARVRREEIDVSCVTATKRFTPRVGVVDVDTPLRVIRTERREPPLLAVTARDRRGVARCQRALPSIPPPD